MKTSRALITSLALGAITALGTKISFLSMLIGLVAFPVLTLAPFSASGPHAEYGFAWIDIKSPTLWALLIAYFTVIYFFLIYMWTRWKRRV